jgi:hypothetical protein
MARRGFQEFQCEGEPAFFWARCEITGCPNCVCIGMSPSLCYQHGIEFGEFTKEDFDRNRAEKTD